MAAPTAPAGTIVTAAGIWYRQENSNRSDRPSTATAVKVTSRHMTPSERSTTDRRPKARQEPITPSSSPIRYSGPGV
jgi:hypothetical protein